MSICRTNNYVCTSVFLTRSTEFLDLLKTAVATSLDLGLGEELNLNLPDLEGNIQLRMMTMMTMMTTTRTNAAAAPTDIPIISALPIMKQSVLKISYNYDQIRYRVTY